MPDRGGDSARNSRRDAGRESEAKAKAREVAQAKAKAKRAAEQVKTRDRHTDKDWEDLLRKAEDHGWVFNRDNGYVKGNCGCSKKWTSIPLTASSSRSLINKRKKMESCPCWANPKSRKR